MTDRPLLSIVLPTRERCRYLMGAIATARAVPSADIEILVSDNASTDGTGPSVRAIADPRLRYVNTGSRLAMSANFEFALRHARGEYLFFIGDDDGVMPGALGRFLPYLRQHRPDAVNWHPVQYDWPSEEDGRGGRILLKPRHLAGGSHVRTAASARRDFLAGRARGYGEGARIYHGIVARSIVEAVMARTGDYFFATAPDVGAALANIFFCREILMVGEALSVSGISAASTGASTLRADTAARGAKNPRAAFIEENLKELNRRAVDPRHVSGTALTFFTLLDVLARLGEAATRELDTQVWRARIERDVAVLPPSVRTAEADLVDLSLAKAGLAPIERVWTAGGDDTRPARRTAPSATRLWPNRLTIATNEGRGATVAEAAALMEWIIGTCPFEETRGRLAVALAWSGALARAASLLAAPSSASASMAKRS